jgi:DNA-binding transcriptional LysR family regulator
LEPVNDIVVSDVRVLNACVAQRSLLGAARSLGISSSSATRQLIRLEASLGCVLADRDSRNFVLTERGQAFVPRALAILDAADAALRAVQPSTARVRGRLRISAPRSIATAYLVPRLPQFLAAFADVEVVLDFAEGAVRLLDENFDIAFRTGPVEEDRGDGPAVSGDSRTSRFAGGHEPTRSPSVATLRPRNVPAPSAGGAAQAAFANARYLFDEALVLVAAAGYFSARPRPREPGELHGHTMLAGSGDSDCELRLLAADGLRRIRVSPTVRSDDPAALAALARSGVGIARVPLLAVAADLAAGTLEVVLPEAPHEARSVYAIVHPERTKSPAVSAFLEFFALGR